ncbi:type IV secretory system conjugative DNA transfer family protein [Kitasatospora aureofaciens]|uniref:type IV secretory system conjugative DNA transfer family protein n=1 Tax=Kitasatospora aureofaciens TaxID=1894 RepID=UPI000A9793EC|nr:TraM recognition domain-containing protein [Kitasatospora aureofaciens]
MSIPKVASPVSATRLRLGRDSWWIGLLAALVVLSALVWLAAVLSGLPAHHKPARVGWNEAGAGSAKVFVHFSTPSQAFANGSGVGGPIPFWGVFLSECAGVYFLTKEAWRRWQRRRSDGADGLATRQQLEAAMGEAKALSRIPALRSSLAKAKPGSVDVKDVAVFCGTAEPAGIPLWLTIEESLLLVAPPREGKTSQFILPAILSFQGTVLATSSKTDVLFSSAKLREVHGKVWTLDATGLSGWPHQLAWPLTDGCEDFQTARRRAETLTASTKSDEGTKNGGYFVMNAKMLITCWLHAAALDKRSALDILKWATAPGEREAVDILARHGRVELSRALAAQHAAAPEERSASWRTAEQSFLALYDDRVASIFAPAQRNFDIEAWLRGGGTLFLIGDEEEGSALAPILATFTQAILDTAKKIAARMPNGRLDPPLGCFLDELANVAPLPQIPSFMSVSGSQNIFVAAVLQNLAQAEERWGQTGVRKMFGAATAKIILGGVSDEQELKAYSALVGEFDEDTESVSDDGDRVSSSLSVRRRAALEPSDIRMLEERTGLLVHRRTPATRVRFVRAHEGPMADEIAAATKEALAMVNPHA